MSHCTECNRWVLHMTTNICDDCQYRRTRRDERMAERESALTIATLAGWAMTDEPPHRYRAAWSTW